MAIETTSGTIGSTVSVIVSFFDVSAAAVAVISVFPAACNSTVFPVSEIDAISGAELVKVASSEHSPVTFISTSSAIASLARFTVSPSLPTAEPL